MYKKRDTFTIIFFAQKGDQKALEELIKRIQKDIYTMFSYLIYERQEIADLTQEVLIKMAKNIYKLKDITKFKPWLNQIITNTFYDYINKNNKEHKIDYDNNKLLEIKDKIGCEPGEKCLFSEMEKLIKAALLSLPEHLRLTIMLREFEGLSYEDIAKLTNTALGTVKSRISRARIRLQEELKEFI